MRMKKRLRSGRKRPRSGRSRKRVGRQRPTRSRGLRRVKLGATYLITKKCVDDQFLIRPSGLINQILLYLLVEKALRYGVIIHGFCFLSNHIHLVVTDVRGKLPAFMREFLGESSKAVQRASDGDRAIWSRKRYSAVELLDLDAAERKDVYTTTNPTRSGLTKPEERPGLTSAHLKFGDLIEVERPSVYFSKRRPKSVSMRLESVALPFEASETESWNRIKALRAEVEEELLRGPSRRPLVGPAAVL